MKSLKRIISAVLMLAMLFSLASVSVFAANPYSEYTPITGNVTLEDGVTSIKVGDTFKVYVSANVGAVSKERVTAFHLLGSVSSNLQIVNSGLVADYSVTSLPSHSAVEGVDYDKTVHNTKTTGTTIDFAAFAIPSESGLAFEKDENGMAKLIYLELKVLSNGTLNVNIADSYIRTAFSSSDENKFCLATSFSQPTYGGDSGKKNPSGTVHNSGKPGKIDKLTVKDMDDALVAIDEENKEISVTVPKGTDVTKVEFNLSYTGNSSSYKKGDTLDLTEPKEITVTGTDGKKVTYTVTAVYLPDKEPVIEKNDGVYSDVEEERWSYAVINSMVKAGLVSGYGNDEEGKLVIKPTALITREEAAKLSVSAYGLEIDENAVTDFADNDEISVWAVPYVSAAVNHPNKMIRGYEDNTFRPLNNVTREEIVTMIINTFGFGSDANAEVDYADKDSITWSAGYISKAANLGIVLGYEDGTFKPSQYVTREEAFAMFDRALTIYKNLMA